MRGFVQYVPLVQDYSQYVCCFCVILRIYLVLAMFQPIETFRNCNVKLVTGIWDVISTRLESYNSFALATSKEELQYRCRVTSVLPVINEYVISN